MSTALSVHAATESEGPVAAVIASLPVSFAPHPATPASAAPDVTAVAGHAGWTRRAAEAILAGSRAVVVTAPAAEDPQALAVVAEENGAAVVLDQRWAGSPALAPSHDAARAVVTEALEDAVLLDSVAICAPGEDPLTLMADHLAAVLQSGVDLDGLKVVQRSSSGYTLAGKLPNGAPAALQGIATASVPAAATISILTSTGRTDITLPDPSAAWPAEVRSVTASGSTTLPTIYESAHRRSWRRVRRLLSTGRPSTDLQHFAALFSLLTRLNS
ncbi:hypothetical protein [Arthrobacter sp. EPSL27]|uniref:hypothetical protein n=1 Tax=Arthrobacter sp. EPSL27 TaxID=1745378 RepID=UPI0007494C02|nr:hypothetical protein [Arthrobacter sp. EPSL27]KUM36778.1 hypothetical protein AR539_05200 [Arthrobacter sp. EPSL27]